MDRAVPAPQDEGGPLDLLWAVAAQRQMRVPHHHVVQAVAELERRVAPQVLIREEEHLTPTLQRPRQHRRRVGRRADRPVVLTAERLQRSRRVHVGDRDDLVLRHLIQAGPARQHVVGGSHVGHRAAGGHVRQNDRLLRFAQNVRALGHEVDAAENDVAHILARGRLLRQLERVPPKVGIHHDLIALVVVAQHDKLCPELLPRSGDAFVQLRWGHSDIFRR